MLINPKLKTKKGIALLLVMLVLGLVLIFVFAISFWINQQLKGMREIGYSVIAFYAADSGIDHILLKIKNNECCTGFSDGDEVASGTLPNGASYTVRWKQPSPSDPECKHKTFGCLRSVGIYRGVSRAIEVSW